VTQADRLLTDPTGVIIEHVIAVEPDLAEDLIRQALDDAAPSRPSRRVLAKALAASPGLLGSGSPEGPPAVGRLVRALLARGARYVVVPLCAGCGRPEPLPQRRGRLRVCMQCDATTRGQRQPCAGCGATRVARYTGRNGEGLCSGCRPKDDIDWTQRICDNIVAVDPSVAADTVREIVVTITRGRPHYIRRLAWDLEDRPGMLTGNAARGTPKVIALIEALRDAGAKAIVRPACPICTRTSLALTETYDGQRVCVTCYRVGKAVDCCRCRRRLPVSRRTDDGEPLCRYCDRADPLNHEACSHCGEVREIIWRTSPTGPICDRCYRPPTAICMLCGNERPCYGVADGTPHCAICTRPRAACHECSRTMRVKGRTFDGRPLCETCFKKNPISFKPCRHCGITQRLRAQGLCDRCVCDRDLTAFLTGPDGHITAPLRDLYTLLMSRNHAGVLKWLHDRNTAVVTLRQIATGECPLDHHALDARTDKPIEHLRAVLTAAGALPPRDEHLAAAERWIAGAVATITDPVDRRTVQAFASWTHLTRLRKHSRRKPLTFGQSASARRSVKAAIDLLAWLRHNGLTLATVDQRDLDRWLDGLPTTLQCARDLVLWAVRTGRAHNISIPPRSKGTPTEALDEDKRSDTANRLLDDQEVNPYDRVAGLLTLLYAQPTSTIVQLTINQVVERDGTVLLSLGLEPLELPTELGQIVLTMVRDCSNHRRPGKAASSWLFPSIRPGQHMSATTLAARLKRIGVRPLQSRTAAIRDLAAAVPAAVVNRLLGISTSTATTWAKESFSTSYAAEVARRAGPDRG
jgi:hypothetical protein